ncbi:hypothetical protein ABZ860_10615 [Microbispora sp. NPDC046973]
MSWAFPLHCTGRAAEGAVPDVAGLAAGPAPLRVTTAVTVTEG